MTGLVTDLQTGVRIARGKYLRRLRRLRGSRSKLVLGVLSTLLVLPLAIALIQWVHGVGRTSRAGLSFPAVAAARNFVLPVLLAAITISGLGVANELSGEADHLLLQSVPNRAYLIGEVLQEFVGLLGVYITPAIVFGAAFVIGAGTPWGLLPLVVGTALLLVVGFLIGHVLAYGFWLGLLAIPMSVGLRKVFGALTTILLILGSLIVGMTLGSGAAEGDIVSTIPTGPPPTPLGWYADLLFVWTPLGTTIGGPTIAAAAILVTAVPLTLWTLSVVAPRFWYATPNNPERSTETTDSSSRTSASSTVGRRSWLASSRTLRLAAGYLRRVRRRPDRALHVLYYLVIATAIGLPGILPSGGAPTAVTGFALVLLGVWLAGGMVCLNPLGDEGAMLGQLLPSETSARTVVVARLVAGLTVGLPVSLAGLAVVVLTTPAFAGVSGIVGAIMVVLLVLASAGSALGIRAAVPQFERGDLFRSVEAVAPSKIAMLFHGVGTVVLTVLAFVVAHWFETGTPGPGWTRGLALAAGAVLLVGVADAGRREATARLATHGQRQTRTGKVRAVYAAAGVAVLSFVMAQVATFLVLTAGIGDLSTQSRLAVLFVTQYTGFLLVALGYLYATGRGFEYLDTAFSLRRDGLWVVGGLVGALALWLGSTAAVSHLGLPAADQSLIRSAVERPELLVGLTVLVLFVNAPVEELLYRNVIQKFLTESLSTTSAIAVTSALFALSHIPAYLDPNPVATGVSVGLLVLSPPCGGWSTRRPKASSLRC